MFKEIIEKDKKRNTTGISFFFICDDIFWIV